MKRRDNNQEASRELQRKIIWPASVLFCEPADFHLSCNESEQAEGGQVLLYLRDLQAWLPITMHRSKMQVLYTDNETGYSLPSQIENQGIDG